MKLPALPLPKIGPQVDPNRWEWDNFKAVNGVQENRRLAFLFSFCEEALRLEIKGTEPDLAEESEVKKVVMKH